MTRVSPAAVEPETDPLQIVPASFPVATRILLDLLDFYRSWISPALHSLQPGGCRYLPTCSEYASIAIAIHGPVRGVTLAVFRLLRCHPFARGGLDPVPPLNCPDAHAISPHEPLP
jgi:putative membrane protein insertion efficiency factor